MSVTLCLSVLTVVCCGLQAAKARAAGSPEVPNLQELLVDVHVHGGTKRKAELPARPGKERM